MGCERAQRLIYLTVGGTELTFKRSGSEADEHGRYARILVSLAECRGLGEIARSDLHSAPEEVRRALLEGARALHPRAAAPGGKVKAYIDGASKGNPGRAGAGVVICDEKGEVLEEKSLYLGETTNNVAEYRALLLALQMAEERGAEELQVFSDSELIVRQVTGLYKVRDLALMKLHSQVKERIRNLKRFTIKHINREENSIADNLAAKAINAAPE